MTGSPQPMYFSGVAGDGDDLHATAHADIARAELPWSAFSSSAGFFASRGWLSFCEAEGMGQSWLVEVSNRAGDVCGVLPVFIVKVGNAGLYAPEASLGPDGRLMAPHRIAILGGRSGYRAGFSLAPAAAGREVAVIRRLLLAADEVATAHGADAIVLAYLPTRDMAWAAQSGLFDASEIFVRDYEATIPVSGSSFADYLNALGAQRRSTARRDLARFEAAGLRVRRLRLSESLDFAARLFTDVKDHHGQPLTPGAARDWFAAQAERLDALSWVFAAVDAAGEIVAFSLSYVWDGVVYVRTVGMLYEAARPSGAYFMTTYYAPTMLAYELGCAAVHVGIKALRAKVMRGAELSPLFALVRGQRRHPIDPASAERASAVAAAEVRSELGRLLKEPLVTDHHLPWLAPTTATV